MQNSPRLLVLILSIFPYEGESRILPESSELFYGYCHLLSVRILKFSVRFSVHTPYDSSVILLQAFIQKLG